MEEDKSSNQEAGEFDDHVLEECVSAFKQKDSIMEVGVLQETKRFLAAGGTPQTVVQLLTENYRGYAEMINLMSSWLMETGLAPDQVSELLKEKLRAVLMEKFSSSQADSIFAEMQSAPRWLDVMIEHPDWRALIYQLSEVHPSCLMLNFAIQRISDAGHQTEIASLATASTNFGVFNRVLTHSLLQLADKDESSLPSFLPDFKKMCGHSQHTYLYTQAVLAHLVRDRAGYNLKKLAQELSNSTLEHGQVGRKLTYMFSDLHRFPNIAEAILAMLSANSTNPADVLKLYKEYVKADPPSVEFLRDPNILELFVRDMFSPARSVSPNYITKYFYVLAYAVSVKDERIFGGKLDKELLHPTMNALKMIQPICQGNTFGSELQAAAHDLRTNLSFPVIAMGVLQWIRANLTDPTYYVTSIKTARTPFYLELLRDIAYKHPFQRDAVHRVLQECFKIDYDLDALAAVELRKDLLDNMLYLMKCGHIMPILEHILVWPKTVDQGLLRHFIAQVIGMIEPPYSAAFLRILLRIVLTNTEAFRTTSTDSATLHETLTQFIGESVKKAPDYGLTEASDQELLCSLQHEFVPSRET